MLVKLDENLSRFHLNLIADSEHQVARVTEQHLSGASDETVWQHVCAEGRFLITLDLDFSDIRRYLPGTHPGILLLRPHNTGPSAVGAVLSRVLNQHGLETLTGCLAVADEHRTRIRRAITAGNPPKQTQ